uniref:Transcriptional regulator n=1 Tax=Bursaphelenchus xylophilus TaxID=6326 RepID=A0A1I7SUZ8_BURXY
MKFSQNFMQSAIVKMSGPQRVAAIQIALDVCETVVSYLFRVSAERAVIFTIWFGPVRSLSAPKNTDQLSA